MKYVVAANAEADEDSSKGEHEGHIIRDTCRSFSHPISKILNKNLIKY